LCVDCSVSIWLVSFSFAVSTHGFGFQCSHMRTSFECVALTSPM